MGYVRRYITERILQRPADQYRRALTQPKTQSHVKNGGLFAHLAATTLQNRIERNQHQLCRRSHGESASWA